MLLSAPPFICGCNETVGKKKQIILSHYSQIMLRFHLLHQDTVVDSWQVEEKPASDMLLY